MIKDSIKKFLGEIERAKSLIKNKDGDDYRINNSDINYSSDLKLSFSNIENKKFIFFYNQIFINNQKRYYGTV